MKSLRVTRPSRQAAFFGPTVANGGIADMAGPAACPAQSLMTHCGSGGCIAAVETMSILAAGEEPSPATQRITPRAFALPVQSNGLLRQEIVD